MACGVWIFFDRGKCGFFWAMRNSKLTHTNPFVDCEGIAAPKNVVFCSLTACLPRAVLMGGVRSHSRFDFE